MVVYLCSHTAVHGTTRRASQNPWGSSGYCYGSGPGIVRSNSSIALVVFRSKGMSVIADKLKKSQYA